jgi:transcriptional regulator with XRE-family HTH domain
MASRAARREPLAAEVARRIADARVARGVTQDQLAERLGTATRNLQRIESGRQNLTLGTIERIAHALSLPARALLPTTTTRMVVARDGDAPPGLVPVLDLAALAGPLRDPRTVRPVGWWLLDQQRAGAHFVVRVEGDSMVPLIPAGAHALFRAHAGEPTTGGVYLWQSLDATSPHDGGSFVVKRYSGRRVSRSHGAVVTLTSLNSAYAPMHFHEDGEASLAAVTAFVEALG